MRLLRCIPTCFGSCIFGASCFKCFELQDAVGMFFKEIGLCLSFLFYGQVFVIPAGADSGMDAVQFALLADSSYDWASLERGFTVLQDCLLRYHRRHAHPTGIMLATALTLLRRQRPWHMDDEGIAVSLQRFLMAVSESGRTLGDDIVA